MDLHAQRAAVQERRQELKQNLHSRATKMMQGMRGASDELRSKATSLATAAKEASHQVPIGNLTGMLGGARFQQQKVERLCALGFTAAAARHALLVCGGRVDDAGAWLLDQQSAGADAAERQPEPASPESPEVKMVLTPLRPGCTARVSGLLHRSVVSMNGMLVTLLFFDADSQRWTVQLPDGSAKALRARNLDLVVSPATASSSSTSETVSPSTASEPSSGIEQVPISSRRRRTPGGAPGHPAGAYPRSPASTLGTPGAPPAAATPQPHQGCTPGASLTPQASVVAPAEAQATGSSTAGLGLAAATTPPPAAQAARAALEARLAELRAREEEQRCKAAELERRERELLEAQQRWQEETRTQPAAVQCLEATFAAAQPEQARAEAEVAAPEAAAAAAVESHSRERTAEAPAGEASAEGAQEAAQPAAPAQVQASASPDWRADAREKAERIRQLELQVSAAAAERVERHQDEAASDAANAQQLEQLRVQREELEHLKVQAEAAARAMTLQAEAAKHAAQEKELSLLEQEAEQMRLSDDIAEEVSRLETQRRSVLLLQRSVAAHMQPEELCIQLKLDDGDVVEEEDTTPVLTHNINGTEMSPSQVFPARGREEMRERMLSADGAADSDEDEDEVWDLDWNALIVKDVHPSASASTTTPTDATASEANASGGGLQGESEAETEAATAAPVGIAALIAGAVTAAAAESSVPAASTAVEEVAEPPSAAPAAEGSSFACETEVVADVRADTP